MPAEQPRRFDSKFVNSIAYFSNGEFVVTVGRTSPLKVWDAQTGTLVRVLGNRTDEIGYVSSSHDDENILSVSNKDGIRVWDAVTGALTEQYFCEKLISIADFTPDDKFIFAGSPFGKIFLWNRENGDLIREFADVEIGAVLSIDFSPNKNQIFASHFWGGVNIWDIESGQLSHKIEHNLAILEVALSPNEKYFITISDKCYLWDRDNYQQIMSIQPLQSDQEFTHGVISPDSEYVLLVSTDYSVLLWNLQEERFVQKFIGHKGVIPKAVFSSDGAFILTCAYDGTARLWETQTGKLLHTLRP
ncbi:MAG: WD40 repeat domain-containing protein [Anaerolineae bacterium]|nr:WD40 repeat domain-containing protein [Anaerolineae bacterium]